MATIDDVAKRAQVSVGTVSRVINNIGLVKKETAERVRRAVKELHYTPNLAARNLRRNESRIILMLAPNFTNPYYSRILSGICDMSRKMGYITLVYNTYDTLSLKEEALTDLIKTNHVDGTIILAINHNDRWLDKYKDEYPIVQCSEYVSGSQLPHISVDNYTAAYETVRYLIDRGHTNIAFVGSKNQFHSTKRRYDGYRQALLDAGIQPRDDWKAEGSVDYAFQSGLLAARQVLQAAKRPTAVFCVSDVLALGVIAQAVEFGLRVPEDLSVTGFDDVDYTAMFHPHLTTVRIPCYDLGKQAMLLLQQHMQRVEGRQSAVYLPHQLIQRESVSENREAHVNR